MSALLSLLHDWYLTVVIIFAFIAAGVFTLVGGIRAIIWLFGVVAGLQLHPVAWAGVFAALLLWLLGLILLMPRVGGIYAQFVYAFFTILVIVSCHRMSMDRARKRAQRDGDNSDWDTI